MSPLGDSNPLLALDFPVPFDRIRAEHVEPAIQKLLAESRARLETIASEAAPRTFANTMLALDRMTEPLDTAMSLVRHLESVATYPELRAAFNAVEPPVSEFHTSIPLHEGLWRAICAYSGSQDASCLQGVQKRPEGTSVLL